MSFCIYFQSTRMFRWFVGNLTHPIALCQYEKIKQFVSTAKSQGATILTGGVRPKVIIYYTVVYIGTHISLWSRNNLVCFCQHLEKGFYIEPTIITDVDTSMQIWREEVFGPVLCVKEFSTEEEAIELANDTQWVFF